MFGTDARFLLAVSSMPSDPLYEVVEMAELDEHSGLWRFRALDMAAKPPALGQDDSACRTCHGSPARPIWGGYLDWQGASAGGNKEQKLSDPQARVLRNLKQAQSGTDRFFQLSLPESYALDQRSFSLPARRYPYANTVFNFELGARVAEGLFLRIKVQPNYPKERWSILSGGWCTDRDASVGALSKLGIDERNDLDIGQLVGETKAGENWNQGSTNLLDILRFLVLDEALTASEPLRAATSSIDSKRLSLMNAWWNIRGDDRRVFLKETFDLVTDDLRPQELIKPIKDALCQAVADEQSRSNR